MFINPMWDSESQRIGKQKCTPLGYRLHLISDLVGFVALLLLPVTFVYLQVMDVLGRFDPSLRWLYAVPFSIALAGTLLHQYSWRLAARKGFKYDYKTGVATWLEDGRQQVCEPDSSREAPVESQAPAELARRAEAAVGCILGTAVGDALGLASEGLSKDRQKRWFPALDGYHLLLGKGLCSDDTEHSCMLAQSIIVSGGDEASLARDFAWRLRWWLVGLPAGIGFATLRSILKLWLFVPGKWRGVYSAGNAPAMRSALLGVCFADDEARLSRINRLIARMTHTDPKAECGALAIALAARCSMRGQGADVFLADLARLTAPLGAAGAELVDLATRARASADAGEATEVFGRSLGCSKGISGYMYHSVPAVLHAWFTYPRDYQAAVRTIIRCGGDTDSTAAMLGAIVGAGVGRAGIPVKWTEDLIEWPRTCRWMEGLARKAAQAAQRGKRGKAHPLSIVGLALRNTGFFILVLMHGLRRLLPPY